MKKSPEPIILAVALVLLGLGAAALAYFYPTLEGITTIPALSAKGKNVSPLKAEDISARLAIWNEPILWVEPPTHTRLFHSDEYLFYPSVYPNGDYIKKVDPNTRSPSGILLTWYKKYNLSIIDANVDREDPDGDGFSNITEYKNETVGTRVKAADVDPAKASNPVDNKSHPDYLSRLRLQKYELQPFHIQFKGYQELNGVRLFQIVLKDVQSANQPPLKKIGDDLGFQGYKITAFHEEFKDIEDPRTHVIVHTDVSTLTVEKPEIDLKVELPFRKEIDSPESTAIFVVLMPADVDKAIKVQRGKNFSLSYIPDVSYRVIDAKNEGAVIRDLKTNQNYSIPKLDPAEWDEVPQPSTSKQP